MAMHITPLRTISIGVALSLLHGLVAYVIARAIVDQPPNFLSYGIFVAATALVFQAGRIYIPDNHMGVPRWLGSKNYSDWLLDEGHHWVGPWSFLFSVEVVSTKVQESPMKDVEVSFNIFDLQRVTATVGTVLWRISDPKKSIGFSERVSLETIRNNVQSQIQSIAKSNPAGVLGVLGRDDEKMNDELTDRINSAMRKAQIPAEIVQISKVELRHSNPQFDRLLMAYQVAQQVRQDARRNNESFIGSYSIEDGVLKYKQHSVDITGIENLVRQFFAQERR